MKLLLGVLVLCCAVGCKSKGPKEPPSLVKTCKKLPGPGGCNTYTCGGNSAITNAFPVNGLRADGECNPDGIQLVPESLANNCVGGTLDMQGDKLVGRMKDGTLCEILKDTRFSVRSLAGTEEIEITDVIEGWSVPNSDDKYTAYRMEWVKETEKEPTTGKRKGLCAKEGQKLRKKLNIPVMMGHVDVDLPDAAEQLVIPIKSELYTEEGRPVPVDPKWENQDPKAEWINLACVDDALAKRKTYHLEAADITKSRAALRMLTADYCGATAWTVRGEWIEWANTNGADIEARWDENGAKCLTAPRILRDDNNQVLAEPPKKTQHLLKQVCQNKCNKPEDWMPEMKTCRDENGVVVKTLKLCEECTTDCPLSSKNAKNL